MLTWRAQRRLSILRARRLLVRRRKLLRLFAPWPDQGLDDSRGRRQALLGLLRVAASVVVLIRAGW